MLRFGSGKKERREHVLNEVRLREFTVSESNPALCSSRAVPLNPQFMLQSTAPTIVLGTHGAARKAAIARRLHAHAAVISRLQGSHRLRCCETRSHAPQDDDLWTELRDQHLGAVSLKLSQKARRQRLCCVMSISQHVVLLEQCSHARHRSTLFVSRCSAPAATDGHVSGEEQSGDEGGHRRGRIGRAVHQSPRHVPAAVSVSSRNASRKAPQDLIGTQL